MNDVIKLTKIDFDSMENSNAEYVSDEKFFTSNGTLSAQGVCAKYISTLTINPYLGWDGEIYPKLKIKNVYMEKLHE